MHTQYLSLSSTHTHMHSLSLTHTNTHTHSISLSFTHLHTNTYTLNHSLTHTYLSKSVFDSERETKVSLCEKERQVLDRRGVWVRMCMREREKKNVQKSRIDKDRK